MAFIAFEVSLELIRKLQPIIRMIARHDPRLADQLREAAQSNALNLAEGSERRGKDQSRFYRTSLASVTEVRGNLRIAEASDYVTAGDLAEVAPLVDRARALDWGLVYPKRC